MRIDPDRRQPFDTFTALLFILSTTACTTVGLQEAADRSPAELFQIAQEASDSGNYKAAMEYYKLFQQKYPDEISRNLWASYEIAFLHHKTGDDEEAARLFRKLIPGYSVEGAEPLPQGPRVLSELVLVDIEADKTRP